MAVPETAVHADRQPAARQDDVGLSRQVGALQAVTKAKAGQQPTHGALRRCAGRLDRPHHGRALLRREDVGHAGGA